MSISQDFSTTSSSDDSKQSLQDVDDTRIADMRKELNEVKTENIVLREENTNLIKYTDNIEEFH